VLLRTRGNTHTGVGERVSAYLAVDEQTDRKSVSPPATRCFDSSLGLERNPEVPAPIFAALLSLGLAALIWMVVSLVLVMG